MDSFSQRWNFDQNFRVFATLMIVNKATSRFDELIKSCRWGRQGRGGIFLLDFRAFGMKIKILFDHQFVACLALSIRHWKMALFIFNNWVINFNYCIKQFDFNISVKRVDSLDSVKSEIFSRKLQQLCWFLQFSIQQNL